MKVTRIILTILAVAVLTAALAAAETGVRSEAGESTLKAPVSGESRDAGSAATPQEAGAGFSVAELFSATEGDKQAPTEVFRSGGDRGEDDPCRGGVCIYCSCEQGGCGCQGQKYCSVLKQFSAAGGCGELTCNKAGDACSCDFTSSDSSTP